MNEPCIFITSDLHFGHNRDFIYRPRNFNNVEEHDSAIIKNWNETVRQEDTVFVLGDLVLGDNQNGISCLSLLNGNIKVIRGNHDTDARWNLYNSLSNIELLDWAYMLKYKKYHFYLSHYPTLTSNYDDNKPLKTKIINLCGHSHTLDAFSDWDKGCIYHCELDAHNCYPVKLDSIIEEIKTRYNKTTQ